MPTKKRSKCILSIKDPFIKYLNHGAALTKYSDLIKLTTNIFDLMKAAKEEKIMDYIQMKLIEGSKDDEEIP